GASTSRTEGTAETIQKRPLITPDEIGQVFARVDDRANVIYPGLGLAVIAGARPFAFRRVNYFEDYEFMGLFDPHPDHGLIPWHEVVVDGKDLVPLIETYKLKIAAWTRLPGMILLGGDEVAGVSSDLKQLAAVSIVTPHSGQIIVVNGADGPVP